MKNITKLAVMVLFCTVIFIAKGQDPQFSQFYANTLYLNPAFAGNNFCPKLTLSYRNQWSGFNFKTYSLAYDKYIPQVSGGLGLLVTQDKSGVSGIATTTVNGMYAYSATINKTISIKAGIQIGFFQNSINWNELEFADMYNGMDGATKPTRETQGMTNGFGIDISAGSIIYTEKFFGGVAVHHLTEPEQTLFGYEDSNLKRKLTIHAGANFKIENVLGDLIISPNILFQKQHYFYQKNIGVYVKKKGIILGGWYRWKDAIIVLIGIEHNKMRIGYSFDYAVSGVGIARMVGSHEISFGYNFKCKPQKRKKYRTAQCPQF